MHSAITPSAPLLRAISVARSVGEKTLLHPASFQVAAGAVLAVLGPSGSGKSTLLRLLNRLDEPTSGTIFLGETDCHTLPPRELRRRVGMVMQRAYLFAGTVAGNIAFGPAQHHQSYGSGRIAALLEQVGLPGYEGRRVETLSGGEAQRVAIARALANEPEMLLLDEPTSALDEASKRGIESLLESIIHQRGLTCVWVTHDREQARRMADAVLLLEGGHVKAFGAPSLLLTNPEVTPGSQLAREPNSSAQSGLAAPPEFAQPEASAQPNDAAQLEGQDA